MTRFHCSFLIKATLPPSFPHYYPHAVWGLGSGKGRRKTTCRQPIWISFENSLEVFPLSPLHIQLDPVEKALVHKGQPSLDSPLFAPPSSSSKKPAATEGSPPPLASDTPRSDPPPNPVEAASVIFSFFLHSLSGLWRLRKVRWVVPANQLCHCPSELTSVLKAG